MHNDATAWAAVFAGPVGGWIVAYLLGKRIDKKDEIIMAKHDAHIKTLETAGKTCDINYQTLLARVFQLEDKKQDKTPRNT